MAWEGDPIEYWGSPLSLPCGSLFLIHGWCSPCWVWVQPGDGVGRGNCSIVSGVCWLGGGVEKLSGCCKTWPWGALKRGTGGGRPTIPCLLSGSSNMCAPLRLRIVRNSGSSSVFQRLQSTGACSRCCRPLVEAREWSRHF